jgi:hypothetical protein
MLARRESFLTASNNARPAERSEFIAWYHACQQVPLLEAQVDSPVLERRIHRTNSSRHPKAKQELIRLLKARLDEKRAKTGSS